MEPTDLSKYANCKSYAELVEAHAMLLRTRGMASLAVPEWKRKFDALLAKVQKQHQIAQERRLAQAPGSQSLPGTTDSGQRGPVYAAISDGPVWPKAPRLGHVPDGPQAPVTTSKKADPVGGPTTAPKPTLPTPLPVPPEPENAPLARDSAVVAEPVDAPVDAPFAVAEPVGADETVAEPVSGSSAAPVGEGGSKKRRTRKRS